MAVDDGLQQRDDVVDVADFLIGDQDVGVLELGHHLLPVSDHIGGDIAFVEFHALGDGELIVDAFRVIDGDDAVFPDLLHRRGDELADFRRAGGDGRDRFDVLVGIDRAGFLQQFLSHRFAGFLDAVADEDRVGPFLDVIDAPMDDRLGEQGGGGRPVAGRVVGLVGDFVNQLRPHVGVAVLQFDLLGDGDPVIGDKGRAIAFVEDDVAAFRADGELDGVG